MNRSNDHLFSHPDPTALGPEMGAREYAPQSSATMGWLEDTIRRHEAALLAIPGVVMITRGMPEPGVEAIIVGVDDAKALEHLPKELDGVRVYGEVTGPIEARPL